MGKKCFMAGILALVVGIGYLSISAYLTDPYSSMTQVKSPYSTSVSENGSILLHQQWQPTLDTSILAQGLAYARTGLRIPLYSLVTGEPTVSLTTEPEIIAALHRLRFNPDKPYVITGSHYSDLYMRNLGIFFNALLDPRLSPDSQDWEDRQRIALQTVAYDLSFLQQNGKAVTTIAPTGKRSFTGLNIYTRPSDSLFGVLYTLKALQDPHFIPNLFPTTTTEHTLPLQTATTSATLLEQHSQTLTTALDDYLASSFDPATGLIRKDIQLSSARDGISRQSSFYDNVIAWATVKLADELGIHHTATPDMNVWKQRIIDTFWDDDVGIFKNDLSSDQTVFSADSLIVTSSGFFDMQNSGDRQKLDKIVQYIQKERLDQPFPLRYSRSNSTNTMHLTVRVFAPSYMGEGIWSHWGMEYIKALSLLSTDQPTYPKLAQTYLEIYRKKMEDSGGYPELYNPDGTLFRSSLIRGVLQSGWVVNYEQAKLLVRDNSPHY